MAGGGDSSLKDQNSQQPPRYMYVLVLLSFFLFHKLHANVVVNALVVLVVNCFSEERRVPTDTGKPGKMRQLFPVRKSQGIWKKILKSQGILSESGKSQGKLGFTNKNLINQELKYYWIFPTKTIPKFPFLGSVWTTPSQEQAQSVLNVELFEFHESIFGWSKVNILTSGYCKKSILVHVEVLNKNHKNI